jgi:hypothetical protein
MKLFGSLLLIGLVLSGCSTLDTQFVHDAKLSGFKHIYVQQSLNDNHGLDILIVKDLQSRGIQAESGPMTLIPRDVKVYLSYEDHWDWDFKDYLISLRMTARDATTDRMLASALYFRPTAFIKTPDYMVRTVLNGLLDPAARSTISLPEPSKASGRNKDAGDDLD